MNLCARSRYMYDVISCTCPWGLLLSCKSSIGTCDMFPRRPRGIISSHENATRISTTCLCDVSVEDWYKLKVNFHISYKELARKGLKHKASIIYDGLFDSVPKYCGSQLAKLKHLSYINKFVMFVNIRRLWARFHSLISQGQELLPFW